MGSAKTHSEIKRLVAEDWVKAEYIGTGRKDHVLFISLTTHLRFNSNFSCKKKMLLSFYTEFNTTIAMPSATLSLKSTHRLALTIFVGSITLFILKQSPCSIEVNFICNFLHILKILSIILETSIIKLNLLELCEQGLKRNIQ